MEQKELPLVSILCPIYNVEAYVEKCVESLFSQSYANLEYVFVDDKCTDNSVAIIQRTLEKHPNRKSRVQMFHHAENRGQAAGRNTALTACSGDFLMFVDADDWIEQNSVELLVRKQLETDADIVYGQLVAHYPTHDEVLEEPHYSNKKEMVMHSTELTIDHSLCKRIFRRSLFVDYKMECVEGLDYGEDHLMMPQLLWYANHVARIEDVIYHYNCWKGTRPSPSLATIHKMWDNELSVIGLLRDFFCDKDADIVNSICRTEVIYLMSSLGQAYHHRTRKKYNEIARILYAMPEQYLSTAKFNSADERLIYRYYDCRLIFRAVLKVIARVYDKFGVNR